MSEIIERNSALCLACDTEITSNYRHDFKTCKCGNLSVDGGRDYLKRLFRTGDWEDTSIITTRKDQP